MRKRKGTEKMKEYKVFYRARGNKDGQLFETSVTADNIKKAQEYARTEFGADSGYTVVSVKLADPQTI